MNKDIISVSKIQSLLILKLFRSSKFICIIGGSSSKSSNSESLKLFVYLCPLTIFVGDSLVGEAFVGENLCGVSTLY